MTINSLQNPNDILSQKPYEISELKKDALKIIDGMDVSEATRKDYGYRVAYFFHFIETEGFSFDVYLRYKRNLQSRSSLSLSSKNKYLASASALLHEAVKYGFPDITLGVKCFRQSKKHKRDGLTSDNVTSLMALLKSQVSTEEVLRKKVIISLLALQGLRQIEIARLDIEDLQLSRSIAFVLGKGMDDKEPISLHPETVAILREYIKVNNLSSGPLLTSWSCNKRGNRLTTRSIQRLVKDLFLQVGINKTVHGFRHFFTTQLIKTYQGNLLEVASYTRHRGLDMLQVYNDSVRREEDLPKFYEAFNGLGF